MTSWSGTTSRRTNAAHCSPASGVTCARVKGYSALTPLIEGPLWLLIVIGTVAGLVVAEFAFRRGFRIGTAWSREADQIRQTIARIERSGTAD